MPGPKKILILCHMRGSGGVEAHVLRLSRLLRENGAEVTVACRVRSADAPLDWFRGEPGVRFVTTPFSWNWPRAAMAWALYVWPRLLPSDFDVLYTLDLSRLVCALRKLIKPSGYIIANRVGEVSEPRIAEPAVVAALDGFIAETQTQISQYEPLVPTRAIPHLTDASGRAQRTRSNTGERLRVAYLGRYERPKGIFRLVDVWRKARPKNAELHFYGVGPHRSELEQYIRIHHLEGEVTVHSGWRSSEEQSAILDSIDLVVLPSESEGLPLVLLEALAHGVPFIATGIGGVPELARDNPDVAVVPLDDAAFCKALIDILGRIVRGEISAERLQRYYRDRYDRAAIAEQWRTALLEPESFWGGALPLRDIATT